MKAHGRSFGVFGFYLLLACGLGARAPAGVASYRETLQGIDGLVDYYTLDGNFDDSFDGLNGFNDGIVVAPMAPAFGEGVGGAGQAGVCDMSYVSINRSIQGDFAIVAWIKTETPGIATDVDQFWQGSGLIYADVPGAGNDFGTAITGNKFAFGVGPGPGGAADTTIHSTTDVTTGQWLQVAAVRRVDTDTTTAEIKVFVNGVVEETIGSLPNVAPLDASAVIYLGGNVADGRYYTGALDEVALFEVALEDAEVGSFFNKMSEGVAAYRELLKGSQGLVDYYDLEGNFDDSFAASNGLNNATTPPVPDNVPIFDAGLNGEFQGALFDGLNDYFNVQRSIQDSFTIMAWIKTATAGIAADTSQFYEGSGLIYADVGGVANDFGTAITGTKFGFGIGNADQTAHSTTAVNSDEWTHLTAVREIKDDLTSELRIYINGVLEATLPHPNGAPLTANAMLSIGGNTIDSRYYTGLIDEVALFGAALDDETVSQAYSSLLGLFPCFTTDVSEGPEPLTVSFDASCTRATQSTVQAYDWDFGDGEVGSGQKVSHTYAKKGTYQPKLTITDSVGSTAAISSTIKVLFKSGDVSPWISTDVGTPVVPGGAKLEGGCLVVFGSGKDLVGQPPDSFHFVYQPKSGDVVLTARLSDLAYDSSCRAGIMLRETTGPDSAFGMACFYPLSNGVKAYFLNRPTTGESATSKTMAGTFTVPNAYLKIERVGAELIGYASPDGAVWTEINRITLTAPPASLLAGPAVTARDTLAAGNTATATFCDVTFGGTVAEICDNGNVDDDGDSLADCLDPDCASAPNCPKAGFHRGDANSDGAINITDGIYILNFLFLGGPAPPCRESANPNDDAAINITDGIYVLNFLFLGGPAPTDPGPMGSACGPDPAGSPTNLGCEVYTKC